MEMPENRKKGLIISFYLSKFDDIAYKNLGVGSQLKTHEYIGQILNIKPRTIQNWRDEFDPYEDNKRAGWYQRPLSPSRAIVKEQFDSIEEYSFREIVNKFLEKDNDKSIDDILSLLEISEDEKNNERNNKSFSVQMAQTGKEAEEYFITNYRNILKNVFNYNEKHTLVDTRLNGCGYDFELQVGNVLYYVEIKGMANENNNIRFTDKEWTFANIKRNNYILVVIKNLLSNPQTMVIRNPYENINAEMKIQQVIQVSWLANIK